MAKDEAKKGRKSSAIQEDQDFILLDSVKPLWYVIQTYVGFEDVVKKLIIQKVENLGLQEKIFEIYIPTKKYIKLNAKGDRKEKEEKIYPGYIYINAVLDKEIGYLIQNTNYVSRIASTGNVAVPLEEGYIEKIKEKLMRESDDNKISATVTKFNLGDMVKVIDGPFKDMSGNVSGIDENSSRVTVILSIFERETEVLLDVLEIKKVN